MLSTNSTSVGATVNTSCDAGLMFTNGEEFYVTTCFESAQWSITPPECIGELSRLLMSQLFGLI